MLQPPVRLGKSGPLKVWIAQGPEMTLTLDGVESLVVFHKTTESDVFSMSNTSDVSLEVLEQLHKNLGAFLAEKKPNGKPAAALPISVKSKAVTPVTTAPFKKPENSNRIVLPLTGMNDQQANAAAAGIINAMAGLPEIPE